MQKLALMMAVMILGMSPAHGCSIGASPGCQGVGNQTEMVPLLPAWPSGDGKTLMAKDTVSSAAAEGNQPVVPGGYSIGRTLRQIQLRVEDLERIGNEVLRIRQDKAKKALRSGRMDRIQEKGIESTSPRVKQHQMRQKL